MGAVVGASDSEGPSVGRAVIVGSPVGVVEGDGDGAGDDVGAIVGWGPCVG